jgi:hypothetical protein
MARKTTALVGFAAATVVAGSLGATPGVSLVAVLRIPPGGSASGAAAQGESEWLLKQLTLRQQRLKELSSGLEEAGFALPSLPARRGNGPALKVRKSWDCTVAPEEEDDAEDEDGVGPTAMAAAGVLPCLIMGEVLPGSKAVSPAGAGKWVTLWELNKMRRQEPQKVPGLWYDQFELDCSAFSRAAGPPGAALALFLDRPPVLRAAVGVAVGAAAVLLRVKLLMLTAAGVNSCSSDWSNRCRKRHAMQLPKNGLRYQQYPSFFLSLSLSTPVYFLFIFNLPRSAGATTSRLLFLFIGGHENAGFE